MSEREDFQQALEGPAVAERSPFLELACGGDAALQERVQHLKGRLGNLES